MAERKSDRKKLGDKKATINKVEDRKSRKLTMFIGTAITGVLIIVAGYAVSVEALILTAGGSYVMGWTMWLYYKPMADAE